jgi:hypothetical protein
MKAAVITMASANQRRRSPGAGSGVVSKAGGGVSVEVSVEVMM